MLITWQLFIKENFTLLNTTKVILFVKPSLEILCICIYIYMYILIKANEYYKKFLTNNTNKRVVLLNLFIYVDIFEIKFKQICLKLL